MALTRALQLKHSELLTWTATPLAVVASHLLLLEAALLELQEYAPMYSTLIDPPYALAPNISNWPVLDATQFKHLELLACTETSFANVASQLLVIVISGSSV